MTTAASHPIFARLFDYGSRRIDEGEQRAHGAQLVRGLARRVLEVGAGNGPNFTHYPTAVTDVVAVEPEPFLRARAGEAASEAPVPVAVVDGTAEVLPLEDESFDAAVVSLVLCSVRHQAAARAEIYRVLRLSTAGFRVEEIEQFVYKPIWYAALTSPHILGRAQKPN